MEGTAQFFGNLLSIPSPSIRFIYKSKRVSLSNRSYPLKDVCANDFELDEFELVLETPWSVQNIETMLLNNITGSLQRIGEGIWKRPQGLASIMAAIAVERYAKSTIAGLIYRSVRSKNLEKAGAEASEAEATAGSSWC